MTKRVRSRRYPSPRHTALATLFDLAGPRFKPQTTRSKNVAVTEGIYQHKRQLFHFYDYIGL